MEKNVLFARILLLILCGILTATCFYRLNETYDPLSRYPYATEKNRATILKYMDSSDIDYIISQQIKPAIFMEFIKVSGFNIHHAYEYHIAKKTQKESDEYIVNFINKYADYFSTNDLQDLLTYYTYADLTAFYENENTTNKKLSLVANPTNPYLILTNKTSIYRYQPSDLVQVDSISVKEEVAQAWNDMKEAYRSMLNGQTLEAVSGYRSFDEINEEYMSLKNTYSQSVMDKFVLPAGQNEAQLGYDIQLMSTSDWMDACLKNENSDGTYDYQSVIDSLSQEQQEQIVWLEENAYHYGFVVRYPQNKTNYAYQPFVLRYVGQDAARKMFKNQQAMEEMNFDDYQK